MIKNRLKNISKLVKLIAVRQLWKLAENLYGIVTQPFLSLKKLIIKDRDKSQMFLLTIVFLMPLLTYLVIRIFWDYYQYGLVIRGVGKIFLIIAIIQIIILGYLGYWLKKIRLKK